MKAVAALIGIALASVALLATPPTWAIPLELGLLAAAQLVLARRARVQLLTMSATTLVLGGLVYGFALPAPPQLAWGHARFGFGGALVGLTLTLRLVGLFSVLAIASRFLRFADLYPRLAGNPRLLYFVGAVLRLVPTIRADARRIHEAQRARGHEFKRGLRSAASWLPLLIPLVTSSLRRTRDQALALRLAGLVPGDGPGGPRAAFRWALIPTLAALAVAGRMVLLNLPNISFSFFIVFISGVAYGRRVGALVGLTSRIASDLLISGLHPVLLAMAPVEALLGWGAGWIGRAANLGQRDREPILSAGLLAGTVGWAYTLAWSVAADTANWLLFSLAWSNLPGGAGHVVWLSLVAAGLAFNIPAALFNAALFATSTYPLLRALRAADLIPRTRPAPVRAARAASAQA